MLDVLKERPSAIVVIGLASYLFGPVIALVPVVGISFIRDSLCKLLGFRSVLEDAGICIRTELYVDPRLGRDSKDRNVSDT